MSDATAGFGFKLKMILAGLCVLALGAVLVMPTGETQEAKTSVKPRVINLPTVGDRSNRVSGPRRITVQSSN
ncbi:MAG: hypothetical protein AAF771_02510 [Pseudomonadota bacterium]